MVLGTGIGLEQCWQGAGCYLSLLCKREHAFLLLGLSSFFQSLVAKSGGAVPTSSRPGATFPLGDGWEQLPDEDGFALRAWLSWAQHRGRSILAPCCHHDIFTLLISPLSKPSFSRSSVTLPSKGERQAARFPVALVWPTFFPGNLTRGWLHHAPASPPPSPRSGRAGPADYCKHPSADVQLQVAWSRNPG